ncbi:hypothetical protein [Burkholderia alba]|uniref:hypothetical protein n=1 Tax=Burkholderia alba TaxID=2683677 RepID=UPI002B053CBD|nr:hypothetical protein [Burkholderia alba]
MKPVFKIVETRTDTRTLRAVIGEAQIVDILAQAVAAAGGVSLSDLAVSTTGYISTSDSSIGPRKEAVIEITIDHAKLPTVAQE